MHKSIIEMRISMKIFIKVTFILNTVFLKIKYMIEFLKTYFQFNKERIFLIRHILYLTSIMHDLITQGLTS